MGGEGSGRKPDPLKQFIPQRAGIATMENVNLELPNYSGMKKFIDTHDVIPPSVSFGAAERIPFMNATADDFDYASGLFWEDDNKILNVRNDIRVSDGTGSYIYMDNDGGAAENAGRILIGNGSGFVEIEYEDATNTLQFNNLLADVGADPAFYFNGRVIVKDGASGTETINTNEKVLKKSTGATTVDWENVKLPTLTSNGFVKTSGGDGTLSIDTSNYIDDHFADNEKLYFGTGDDIEFYFDGNVQRMDGAYLHLGDGKTNNVTQLSVRDDTTVGVREWLHNNISNGFIQIIGAEATTAAANGKYFQFYRGNSTNNIKPNELIIHNSNNQIDFVTDTAQSGTNSLEIDSSFELHIPNDNKNLYFGAGDDVGVSYNGTTNSLVFATAVDMNFVSGNGAGASLTTGARNFLWGDNAGYALTTGSDSIAIGKDALSSENTIGMIAIGRDSLKNNTGYYNVAVGQYTLSQGGNTNSNSAFGFQAGYNTSGSHNLYGGYYAGQSAGACGFSVHLGSYAGQYCVGNYNVSVGYQAGRLLTSGSNLTSATQGIYIGQDARASANSLTNEIVIGAAARGNGSNTITLGNTNTTGTYLTAGDLHLVDSGAVVLGTGNDAGIWYDGTNLHIDAQLVGSGTIILDNLPTSSAGLPTGAVWNNSNVLNIV